MLGRISKHHLVTSVVGRLLLRKQACGIVAATFGCTGTAGGGPGIQSRDPDAYRLDTGGEVRAGWAGEAAAGDATRRANAEKGLRGEHERSQIETLLWSRRYPCDIRRDQFLNAGKKILRGQRGESQPPG